MLFAQFNVTVTGGLSPKRHLDSPLSIRHNSYLHALFNLDSWALQHCIEFDNVDKKLALPRRDFKPYITGVKFNRDGSVQVEPIKDENNSVINDNQKDIDNSVPAFTIIDSEENRTSMKYSKAKFIKL